MPKPTHPNPSNRPLPVRPAPDLTGGVLAPLLQEPFGSAWSAGLKNAPPPALREKLLSRLAASRAAEAPMWTVRRRRNPVEPLADGVGQQWLYRRDASAARSARPGEPERARLVCLAAGAHWLVAPDGPLHQEWLVLEGSATLDGEPLALRDYVARPAGAAGAAARWASAQGVLLFLRESAPGPSALAAPLTVRDADAGWPEFAPGVRRRVLWQHDGQAAMLYHADPGATVPQHSHGHDEECLMLQGELFLDDVLMQPGDYQLAPAGSGHHTTGTDTGAVIYAHGDLDLRFAA
jgi:quercetin dioxygenase-like cupin family protein